jgi:hypothetical protein
MTTTISFQCYSCHQVLKVGADKAGKRGKCPSCGTTLTIPVASSAEPPRGATPPPRQPPSLPPNLPMAQLEEGPVAQSFRTPMPPPGHVQPPMQQPVAPLHAELIDDAPGQGGYAAGPVYAAEYAEEEPFGGGGFGPQARLRLGILLVFIAFCVIAGAFALQLIGYILESIFVIQGLTASTGRPGSGTAALVLVRIATLLALGGSLCAIAGYVFCMLGPKGRGTFGMSIALLVVAGIHLVFLIIKVVFLFRSHGISFGGARLDELDGLFNRLVFVAGFPGMSDFGTWFVLLLANLLFAAELILFPLFLRAALLTKGKKRTASSCMAISFLAGGYAGLRLLAWVMFYVVIASRDPSKAIAWIALILGWFGTFAFIGFIIWYILLIWKARDVLSK